MQSEAGVQQGDPLGPLLFSIVIKSITECLSSELNCWHLDDGTIGGEVEIVARDLEDLIESIKSVGLEINFAKCELFISANTERVEGITNRFQQLATGIKITTVEKLRLL